VIFEELDIELGGWRAERAEGYPPSIYIYIYIYMGHSNTFRRIVAHGGHRFRRQFIFKFYTSKNDALIFFRFFKSNLGSLEFFKVWKSNKKLAKNGFLWSGLETSILKLQQPAGAHSLCLFTHFPTVYNKNSFCDYQALKQPVTYSMFCSIFAHLWRSVELSIFNLSQPAGIHFFCLFKTEKMLTRYFLYVKNWRSYSQVKYVQNVKNSDFSLFQASVTFF